MKVDFTKGYHLPLKLDRIGTDIVWTAEDERAFDFVEDGLTNIVNDYDRKLIVDVINGKSGLFSFDYELKYEDGYIYYLETSVNDWCKIISIRNWGHLTGIGGLNLSEEEATSIQDAFALYVINKLKQLNKQLLSIQLLFIKVG